MFPFCPHWTGQKVDRTRLDTDCLATPTRGCAFPKSEVACPKERYSGDVRKMRLVPMPSDPGARPIFVDENLREHLRG